MKQIRKKRRGKRNKQDIFLDSQPFFGRQIFENGLGLPNYLEIPLSMGTWVLTLVSILFFIYVCV